MIPAGRYEFTDRDAELLIHTTCEGPAARMGHDLTLIARPWNAELEVGETPDQCSLTVTVRVDSLTVQGTKGGLKPMTDSDRRDIERNAVKALGAKRNPELHFVSASVSGMWEHGEVTGDLTLNGTTQSATFQVVQVDDHYRLGGAIVQTQFGIKPYSTMVGALRIADSVLFEVSVPLGS